MHRFDRFSFRRRLALAVAGLTLAPLLAMAQGYPDRPITLIVPNAAGGATDILARGLAKELSTRLKQPVVVQDLGGASGAIGAMDVLRAAPDGYTLFLGTTSDMVVTPIGNKAAGYAPKDFTPIAKVGVTPLTLVTRPGLGVKTTDQLIALARQKPGTLSIATTGNLSLQAYAAVALTRAANIHLITVPYRGGSQIVNDLMSGQIDLGVLALPGALPFVKSGKLQMLGVLSEQRSSAAPDIPSVDEAQGIKGVSINIWAGLAGPPKLPANIVETLNHAVQDALGDKTWNDKRISTGDFPAPPASAADFAQFVNSEAERYAALATGLKH